MMGFKRKMTAVAVAAIGLALATPAFAQDYDVTTVTNQYHTPPSDKVNLNLGDDRNTQITLPFDFVYYGKAYTRAFVGSNGFIQIDPSTTTTWYPAQFPSSYDGTIGVRMVDLAPHNGGGVYTHTSGTSPNRIFHVTWENVPRYSTSGTHYLQIQLYEANGRIILSYGGSLGNWYNSSFRAGIQGVGSDRRYVALFNNGTQSTRPTSDYQFDPTVTTFSGNITMDRLISDDTGIGNSVQRDMPVVGARVELLDGTGKVAAFDTTDTTGAFAVQGLALDSSSSGALRMVGASPAADVRLSRGGQTHTFPLVGTVTFGADTDLGAFNLDESNDTGATFREPMNIALTLEAVRQAVSAEMGVTIPTAEVVYDRSSTGRTSYTPDSGNGAFIQIGSTPSGNPDAWDNDVLTRVYTHFLLEVSNGVAGGAYNGVFDTKSNTENAFAEGLGYFLASWMNGTGEVVDGITGSAANVIDLDTASPTTARGPDVAAWCALALYDIVDDANEAHDRQNGSEADGIFDVVKVLTGHPTAATFYEQWGPQGYSGTDLSRNFIYHGLLGDDIHESNDEIGDVAFLGSLGRRVPGMVLNLYNEDWLSVVTDESFSGINVDVVFDRGKYPAQIELEILDEQGNVLATGAPDGLGGPWRATTGPVGPGVYLARIVHVSGSAIPEYAVQIYASLSFGASLPDWTVDRPYDASVQVKGGIQPYDLKIAQLGSDPVLPPPGLVLSSGQLRMSGTPTDLGTYNFVLQVDDSADPPTSIFSSQSMTINDRLELTTNEFTPFPIGAPVDHEFVSTGGTPPLAVAPAQGNLPAGLTLSTTELKISGTPTEAGSGNVQIEATDFAGSGDASTTTVVVCPPLAGKNQPLPLEEGIAAGGLFFDAVKGSYITFKMKTARKQAKRLLAAVLADSGGLPIPGAAVAGGKGKAFAKKVPAPSTGRFFMLVSSDNGPASQLLANGKLVLPKKQAGGTIGVVPDFGFGDDAFRVEFGALQGATFNCKCRTTDDLRIQLQAAIAPDGTVVPNTAFETFEKGARYTISGTATDSGTWTLLLTAHRGPRGTLGYKLKIRQPKGGVFSLD